MKQGPATLMVSLPSKWAKANRMDKGGEVEMEEQGTRLIISADKKKAKKEISLNLSSGVESSARTIITNVYREGYDYVKVSFVKKEILKVIEDSVRGSLLGFEVIKKGEGFCVIENITEPAKEQFDNIFSKMLMNIDELFDLTKARLSGEGKEDFEEVEQRIKQFDNFCRRIVAKEGSDKAELKLTFHSELIHAQRELYHLLRFLQKNKVKVGKAEIELLDDCKVMFDRLKEAYTEKKIEKIEHMHELEEKGYKKGYSIINKADAVVVHHIINAMRGFYLASSPLVTLALQKD